MYKKIIKRALDVFFAGVALFILFPFFTGVTCLLFFYFRGSPFFVQRRIGYRGAEFTIYKFRTMKNVTDEFGVLIEDEYRLTALGNFLRYTSIDELPQLVNVLKGEMSFIGPRPMLIFYNELYNDFQRRRNEIRPGITGWAQIHGRNNLPWLKRFEYDVWYVDHCSFLLDLKIFFRTFVFLLFLQNKLKNENPPSTEFDGNI